MSSLEKTIESLGRLIGYPTVSSTSNTAISAVVSEELESLGFQVEQADYIDAAGQQKTNVLARRDPVGRGSAQGGLAYFCHTDVVPAADWTGPGGDPFAAVVQADRVYGRGACDMKGSLAVMLSAVAALSPGDQTAPLWIVATADEEVGFAGAKQLVGNSPGYRQLVAAQPLAIIGEPTRLAVVHAHKGIVGFRITSQGRAAHSSTTAGINANEAMVPMLVELLELAQLTRDDPRYWDARFDPPVLSWNFGVSDRADAVNVTPRQSVAWFSMRPMPSVDGEDLVARAQRKAATLGLQFERIEGGQPVWCDPDAACIQAMCELAGGGPQTVCYGTDGGEFAELSQRLVCGPGDIAQAHTSDEWIELDQIRRGIDLYTRAIVRWCT